MQVAFSYTDSSDHLHFRPLIKKLLALGYSVGCIAGGDPAKVDKNRINILIESEGLQLITDKLVYADAVITTRARNSVINCIAGNYIRLFSSIGDTGINYSKNTNRLFDLILVPGLRSQQLLREHSETSAKIRIVGIPELDSALMLADVSEYEICYAPTWGRHSSLGVLGADIAKIGSRYKGSCLFRPHINTRRHSSHWLELFKTYGWEVANGLDHMTIAARKCGIIITDSASGATWEAALANEITIACRNPSASSTVMSREVEKYVHTVETVPQLEKALEKEPGVKAVPIKYCDHRGLATEKTLKAITNAIETGRKKLYGKKE